MIPQRLHHTTHTLTKLLPRRLLLLLLLLLLLRRGVRRRRLLLLLLLLLLLHLARLLLGASGRRSKASELRNELYLASDGRFAARHDLRAQICHQHRLRRRRVRQPVRHRAGRVFEALHRPQPLQPRMLLRRSRLLIADRTRLRLLATRAARIERG